MTRTPIDPRTGRPTVNIPAGAVWHEVPFPRCDCEHPSPYTCWDCQNADANGWPGPCYFPELPPLAQVITFPTGRPLESRRSRRRRHNVTHGPAPRDP